MRLAHHTGRRRTPPSCPSRWRGSVVVGVIVSACSSGGGDDTGTVFAACDAILDGGAAMTGADVEVCVDAYGSFSLECEDGTVVHQLAITDAGEDPWVLHEGDPPRRAPVESFDDLRPFC